MSFVSGPDHPRFKHGLSKHPLHQTWRSMKDRCYNPNCEQYEDYGGRGIKMCRSWRLDFKVFYDWAISHGWRKDLEIDRKNNNRGYAPWNCRFVTSEVNNNNTRRNIKIIAFGKEQNLRQLSRHKKCIVSFQTLYSRLQKGWNPEEAITTPGREEIVLTIYNETKTLAEWVKDARCLVGYSTFRDRIKWDWPPRKALETPARNQRSES